MTDPTDPFPGLPSDKQPLARRYFEALADREDSRFEVLTRLDVGEEFVEWSRYNYETLLSALQVDPRWIMNSDAEARIDHLRTRLVSTFSNYSSGACALRDYIGTWSKEHRDVSGINAALLALKVDPAFKVLKRIRNRMMHGAVCFAGVQIVLLTVHSGRPPGHWAFLTLTAATLQDIQQESPSRGGRVSDQLKVGEDWMRPLIEEVQSALTLAWESAAAAFRTKFGHLDDRRKELRAELDALAARLLPWSPATEMTLTDASGKRSLGRGLFQATPDTSSRR